MKLVDARKMNCPQPLILTKKALEEENSVLTIVDNDVAKENIIKLCNKMGYKHNVTQDDRGTCIQIDKEECKECIEADKIINNEETKGYVFGTNILGSGSDELGALLMKGFIYAITQAEPKPKFMIFLNSGVKLTTEGSDSINDIKQLLEGGTRIVSCGTCLDYYKLKEKLQVGEVTNMYDIVETISNADNVITLN